MHGPLGEAVVRYGPSKVRVLRPGSFVRCAVSGEAIPLEDLRYWSVERQEAYASAAAALEAEEKARRGAVA
jgi:hypothetical protein